VSQIIEVLRSTVKQIKQTIATINIADINSIPLFSLFFVLPFFPGKQPVLPGRSPHPEKGGNLARRLIGRIKK
jgi:hypothetical protein